MPPARELVMRRLALTCLICIAVVSPGFGQVPSASIREADVGRRGKLDGVWQWMLPDTPNGLRPTQSWHATGSSPDGDIYIAGMDHVTIAALYRLKWRADKLQFVGDARSASEAVKNWMPGETAQKFHTRPLWHRAKSSLRPWTARPWTTDTSLDVASTGMPTIPPRTILQT